MATRNGEKYVLQQLRSILDQLSGQDEVLVSDDGSSDETLALIRGMGDLRVRILPDGHRRSVIRNFEYLLGHASGEIVFLSDQDDVWLEGKVSACTELLTTYDIVVTDCRVVDEDLRVMQESFFAVNGSGVGLIRNLKKNAYLGGCMAFRRDVLRLMLPFPSDIPMHDLWIGFVGDLFYKTYFLRKPFVLYRRHGGNASSTAGQSGYTLRRKLSFRWNVLKYLPLLYKRRYLAR